LIDRFFQLLLIIIFATHSGACQSFDYILYEGENFNKDLLFIADSLVVRKIVFRNCTFNNSDVIIRSTAKESLMTIENNFDSLVFENCKWTAYKQYGIRLRGSHRYSLVDGCEFIRDKNSQGYSVEINPRFSDSTLLLNNLSIWDQVKYRRENTKSRSCSI